MLHLFPTLFRGVVLASGLGLAACAQQAAPMVSAPPASQMSLPPSGPAAVAPAAAASMPGHEMSGMNMQQMMAHCAQMRGMDQSTMSPQMRQMMAQCQQMQRMGH